jgi:hypothetical protein
MRPLRTSIVTSSVWTGGAMLQEQRAAMIAKGSNIVPDLCCMTV